MGIMNAAIDRCERVTAGVETLTCISAIESGIEHYVDLVSIVMRDLRNAAGLIDSTAPNIKPGVTSAGEEFIRGSLSLLEFINAVPTSALDLEASLTTKVLKIRTSLRPMLESVNGYSEAKRICSLTTLSVTAHASRTRKLVMFLEKTADAAAQHSLDASIVQLGIEHMNALSRQLEKFVHDALLGRVTLEIKGISKSEIWAAKQMESAYKLPTFSAYPQERVTNAGEYLLSLPQHLDSMHDDEVTKLAAISIAADTNEPTQQLNTSESWIAKVAEASAEMFLKEVQSMKVLTDRGAAQLAADLEYFSNIVAALSLAPPNALIAWCKCVSTPRDEYAALISDSANNGIDSRIARAVAALRDITLA
jgi:hypothetical protein